MPVKNIVIGQKITPEKKQRARQLRLEMTPAERILWGRLRKNRLEDFHFRRQQVIDGFIVDFYCHTASLIIEVDGGIHKTKVEQDAERDAHFTSRGFRILHFKNEDIETRLSEVINLISKACLHPSPNRGGGGGGVLEAE